MRQVHISKLSDIKSVFNSPSDNEQFYRVITNSSLNEFENIELAQPVIRQSHSSIIWKAKSTGNFINFNSLTTIQQQEVGKKLELFYKQLKSKAKDFRNITPDFAEKIIQVPSLNSLLIDNDSSKIIIVNWGFLEDSFNRSDSLISKLFPKIENSILVKVIDEKSRPIERCEIQFSTKHYGQTGLTNEKGFARFQNLTQGQEFNLKLHNKGFRAISENFVCDGREEYCIKLIKEKEPEIITPTPIQEFDDFVPIKENIEEEPYFEEETTPTTIKFVNTFNRPIKNLHVKISNELGEPSTETTNKQGEIAVDQTSKSLSFELTRRRSLWDFQIDNTLQTKHIIKLKPQYPWLWWLLILLLLFLWLWCLLSDCNCGRNTISNSSNQTYVPPKNNPPPPAVLSCNTANKSGGEGITKNQHFLGDHNGTVTVTYDMENVPDKMEVYYEGTLISSTSDISGNQNGFVGENNQAGCCGILEFPYKKNNNDFCTVIITGSNQTSWRYTISCPQ